MAAGGGWFLRGLRHARSPKTTPTEPRNVPSSDYLEAALRWCREMSGALRVTLWSVTDETLTPMVASGGPRPPQQIARGDTMLWAARERVSMRIDPRPTWSTAERVIAVPLDSANAVLTLELPDDLAKPSQFDGLALYVAAIMNVEAQMTVLAQQHARADDLIGTLRELPTATDAEALSQQLVRAANNIVGGEGAALSIWEHDGGRVAAVIGDGVAVGATFSGAKSESALAVRAGATIVRTAGSLGALPIVAPGERFRRRPNAIVATPLKVGADVVAVLTVWTAGDVGEHAVRDLETLAPYAALQLRQARAFTELRTIAEHDALTGMHNRHAFEVFFAAETARYDRYHRPFSLAIFDIDHFKSVNDRFGHDAGDYILQQVASVIATTLRSVDFAARMGGEEFVVVFPETGARKGSEIAERIRNAVAALQSNYRGQAIDVRISAGVSAIPDCVATTDALLKSADTALYAAKNGGRNRVVTAAREPVK